MKRGRSEAAISGSLSSPVPAKSSIACTAGLSIIASAVFLLYRPDVQPIFSDGAYLIYMAQAAYRGEPLYQTTSFGYAPVGAMLSAAAMHIGGWLNVPTYLAPRYLSAVVFILSCAMLSGVAGRIMRSAWAGAIAGLTLTVFIFYAVMAASNLEPKALVLFFTLAAMSAVQKKRWWCVGVASGLAGMCWQPAVVVPIATVLTCLGQPRKSRRAILLSYSAGLLTGILPVLLYLSLTAQWGDFVQQAVLFKLRSRPDIFNSGFINIAASLLKAIGFNGLIALAAAIIGFALHLRSAWGRRRSFAGVFLLHPRYAALGPLTSVWVAYYLLSAANRVEAHGPYDFIPFLAFIALWAAWCLYRVCSSAEVYLRRSGRGRSSAKEKMLAAAALVVAAIALANGLRYRVGYTLMEEISFVESVVSPQGQRMPFLAINAEEFYVLTGLRSDLRILRVVPYFIDFMQWRTGQECGGYLNDLKLYQSVIIKKSAGWENACLIEAIAGLQTGGWRETAFHIGKRGQSGGQSRGKGPLKQTALNLIRRNLDVDFQKRANEYFVFIRKQ